MEGDLSYHRALLEALRRHRTKFACADASDISKGPGGNSREFRLRNDREFFEVNLLRVLSRSGLEDEDIRTLPPETAEELLAKLGDVLGLLNEIATSKSFESGTNIRTTASAWSRFASSESYPKLENVLSFLDRSEGPFDLASGTSSSIFSINTFADGLAAREQVKKLNKILDGIERLSLPKHPSRTIIRSSSHDDWLESFTTKYREFVGKILDPIREQIAHCESSGCITLPTSQKSIGGDLPLEASSLCNSPRTHEVMIQLQDIALSDLPSSETDLDIWLSCPKSKPQSSQQWQNTRCRLQRNSQIEITRKRLCDLVAFSLRRQQGLILVFEQANNFFNASPEDLPVIKPEDFSKRNLKEMITKHRVFDTRTTFKLPERRALSAKLALNLLVFCAWRHTSRSWDDNAIHFVSSSNDPGRKLPYISCLVGKESTPEFRTTEDGAPIQCFTEFAKLLLEIEYGSLPSGDFSADNDYGWTIIRDFYKDQHGYDDPSKEKYLEAVDACLRFDQLFNSARNTSFGKVEDVEETYRRLVSANILRNIVAELPAFKQSQPKRARQAPLFRADDSQTSDSSSDNGNEYGMLNKSRTAYTRRTRPTFYVDKLGEYTSTSIASSSYKKNTGARPYLNLVQSQTKEHLEFKPIGSGLNDLHPSRRIRSSRKISFQEATNFGSLFDSESTCQPPPTANSAKSWFAQLRNSAHSTVQISRRSKDRAVKVAVLDTGIDKLHPKIQEHLKQNGSSINEDCRDWAKSLNGTNDCVGHGTAVCDVLLQAAKVHLYVGKVSDSAEFNSATPARLAQAIEHAASEEGWNVDIIVLSLGFEREDDAIRKAVQNAFTKDKIILAAASNSGSIVPNKRVSYPAKIHGQVLSIRSAIGYGARSLASPAPSDGSDNFMVLGEGIEVAWPVDLNDGLPTRYVSGSSFATPLAAGIAALVLEFSIQRDKKGPNISKESAHRLWTYRGIRSIFQYMSAVTDQRVNMDCPMISPWKLFDPDGVYNGYILEIEKLMKSL